MTKASAPDEPLQALRVLLVDDDAEDAVLFAALLKRVAPGCEFDHVEDATTARESLHGAGYDLCFFDYHLGEDTGLDLLRAARADGFDRPVIMLAGQGDERIAAASMKAGASDYLTKSGLDAPTLAGAIRHARWLNSAEQRRRRTERALRISEARYRELVDHLPVILCELAPDGETLFTNRALTAITGYAADEVVERGLWEALSPELDERERDSLQARLRGGDLSGYELQMRDAQGRMITIEWNTTLLRRDDGSPEKVIAIGMDVTERARLRDELMWLAVRDELTGLSNRRGFLTLAEQQLKAAARDKRSMLAVFVDIDGLKSINDQLGHAEGDRALKDMAAVMRETFRDSDVVGRIGGDEMVALVTEGSPFRSDGIIQRLQTVLANFNAKNDRRYYLSASIGVARYDPDSPTAVDKLVNRADSEMYEHKQRRLRRDVVRKAGTVQPAE